MYVRKVVTARYDSREDLWNLKLDCGHEIGVVDVPYGQRPADEQLCVVCDMLDDSERRATSDGAGSE